MPILASVIYEGVYRRTIANDLSDYSDLVKSPVENYGLVSGVVLISDYIGTMVANSIFWKA